MFLYIYPMDLLSFAIIKSFRTTNTRNHHNHTTSHNTHRNTLKHTHSYTIEWNETVNILNHLKLSSQKVLEKIINSNSIIYKFKKPKITHQLSTDG